VFSEKDNKKQTHVLPQKAALFAAYLQKTQVSQRPVNDFAKM
jgi:hypothetical protein